MRSLPTRILAAVAITTVVLAGCGGGDTDDAVPPPPTSRSTEADDAASATAAGSDAEETTVDATSDPGDQGAASGGGTGTLVLDGESIPIDRVLCHLESQPAAAGGGNILFVVQAHGTNASGEPVMVDVSRFDEASSFAGDSIDIVIGDYMAGEETEYWSRSAAGTVDLSGTTATVDDLAFDGVSADDTPLTATVSFVFNC